MKFTVSVGEGGGVVVLRDGKLLGGEQGSYYVGNYHTEDSKLVADVKVKTRTMVPGMTYVLGANGRVYLEGLFSIAIFNGFRIDRFFRRLEIEKKGSVSLFFG